MIGKRSGYRWIMLSLSFAIAFLLHLLLFATAPMVTVIMTDMDLSHASFGFLFSVAMISLLLFRIPWGLIGDRIGYLNVFRIILPMSAAFALLRTISPTYLTFVFNQFFPAICKDFFFREFFICFRNNKNLDSFTNFRMGNSDDSRV